MRYRSLIAIAILPGLFAFAPLAGADSEENLSWSELDDIYAPVKKWVGKLRDEKNDDGVPYKKATYSKTPQRVDDETFEITVHVNTAREASQLTERYTLTVKSAGKDKWEITEEKAVDSYVGMYRDVGVRCYPFDSFRFDREGLKLSAENGSVCESYMEGRVSQFGVHAANIQYEYAPPAHAALVHTGHDFYRVHRLMQKDHSGQLDFDPEAVMFGCDEQSCEELLDECFEGLERGTRETRGEATLQPVDHADWAKSIFDRWRKERKENAFAHFRPPDRPGNRYYSAYVLRNLGPLDYGIREEALPGDGVVLAYDNWEGWEVQFIVVPRNLVFREQLAGVIYGYYTEETIENSTPYELEQRENYQTRWHEVYKIDGTVELALSDPEMMDADIEYGITLKEQVKELPFYITAFSETGAFGRNRPAPLFVNSIRLNGEELTWVRTGRSSGLMILPEQTPPGTKLDLKVNFSTRCIINYTHSYSYMNRFGWMPFVDFGDFIDEFELTIKSPSKYAILGIGHKVEEKVEDDVRISHWKAENPVVFPTIIFGRYESDTPGFEAKKSDGTVIPVEVHVDKASFVDWGIRPKQLRPIAEQAANAINLYTHISGLDYPYGELNLVNDPLGFLYGQAPSSLIYLGSGVFRGEGTLAPYFADATGIAKFLKSVTAHEVGHQWWGSSVSNANSRNYWFVESLAEYFSAVFLEAVYGWKEYEEQVDEWRRDILDTRIKGSVQNASTLFAGEDGFGSYQAAVYAKGPYAFHILRETFKGQGPRGPEGADAKFFAFLKAFSQELAEKREIVTLDIQQAAEKALGGVGPDGQPYNVDLAWFFDQWIRGVGLPQFAFDYDVRKTEDGGWLIEGRIRQRVVIGSKREAVVAADQHFRGVVEITAKTKNGDFSQRIVIDGSDTPIRLKVPERPLEVTLNDNGGMLSHAVVENQEF